MSATTTRPRDVQVAEIATGTTVFRSRTWDQLKFEAEYSRQKGTTVNSYLIQARDVALIDPPGQSFSDIFIEELQDHEYYQQIDYIVLTHANANRIATLKTLLPLAYRAQIVCSKPAAITLKAAFPDTELPLLIVRAGDVIDLGEDHELKIISKPTPRHPDGIAAFDTATRILFSDKLFGAHLCGDEIFDEDWKAVQEDRQHYFTTIHATHAKQVEDILDKFSRFKAKIYAPGHGPIVRFSVSRLMMDYRDWCNEQKQKSLSVALLYTSAYGNTGMMANAIGNGLSNNNIFVEAINCEYAKTEEVVEAVERCDGFVIGSPTLGGHAPTQIQTALGLILANASKTKMAGVFGSYGWSGEAIDLLESKLLNAGYALGFDSLRVKFKPTPDMLQQCEDSGKEFAQALKKQKKARTPKITSEAQVDRTEQAIGRVVGSLCVITLQRGNTKLVFLTSWVSQATFNPPGVTVALPKDKTEGILDHPGDRFVINVVKEGSNIQKYFQKIQPGKDPLEGVEIDTASNDNPYLKEALSYLECTVQSRLDCNDHWLLYAVVDQGEVLEANGVTAVLHRKSASAV
ncbi:diflavin flavoprotein [filamentous cyanobacterium LEGE 11480]|uniref:Diflavin flavoprotein n=1 Tax=Romeriopsis navalis LEGE 11480 TaxID=2777977 RepID=A0A928VIM4_9CYAN|nr:diflavin flavoprotein [Romeriopsis navalis]MBE9028448.1 diflavin flavoprotein [Romeriopsis navalis LEGE 11480]